MGIYLGLRIAPYRIDSEDWRAAYQDSLKIIQQCRLFECRWKEQDGLTMYYGAPSEHRELESGLYGWHSTGDCYTGSNTEDFELYEDFMLYRDGKLPLTNNGKDILLDYLQIRDYKPKGPEQTIGIWGDKTQGEYSHKVLLAVGCMLEDRFPDAVLVRGDITVGQCRSAVKLASEILGRQISLPVRCNMEKLLARLKAAEVPKERLLEAFFDLTLEAKNLKMGTFLKENIAKEHIYKYYLEKLLGFDSITRSGVKRIYKEYLGMGFDFADLCRIFVEENNKETSKDKKQDFTAENFLRMILESKLHIKKKTTYDFTKTREDEPESDDLETFMQRILADFVGGSNCNVDAYIPLDTIVSICNCIFGHLCNVNEVVDELVKELEESSKKKKVQSELYDGVLAEENLKEEEGQKYDITQTKEIGFYQQGDTISPELEEKVINVLVQTKGFGDKEIEKYRQRSEQERRKWFLNRNNRNGSVDIMMEIWDFIFENVMNEEKIYPYLSLFCLDVSTRSAHELIQVLMLNQQALEYFWNKISTEE